MKEIKKGQIVDDRYSSINQDEEQAEVEEVKQIQGTHQGKLAWLTSCCTKNRKETNLIQKPTIQQENKKGSLWSAIVKRARCCTRKKLIVVYKKKQTPVAPARRYWQSTDPLVHRNQQFESRSQYHQVGARPEQLGGVQSRHQAQINMANSSSVLKKQTTLQTSARLDNQARSLWIANKRQRQAYFQRKKDQLLRMYTSGSQRTQQSVPRASILTESRAHYRKSKAQQLQQEELLGAVNEQPVQQVKENPEDRTQKQGENTSQPFQGFNFNNKKNEAPMAAKIEKGDDKQLGASAQAASPFAFLKQAAAQSKAPAKSSEPANPLQKKKEVTQQSKGQKEGSKASGSFKEDFSMQAKRQNASLLKNMSLLNQAALKPKAAPIADAPTSEVLEPQLTSQSEIEHPDEETLDELNLPQLNLAVLRHTLVGKHKDLLVSIEQLNDMAIMKLVAQRIRNTFAFLKNGLVVVATEDLLGTKDTEADIRDAWEDFLATYQDKIYSRDTETVIVINAPGRRHQQGGRIKRMEMIIVDGAKIARLAWSDEESEPQWSDDGVDGAAPSESRSKVLDEKLLIIHRILNGEKQKLSKPKAPVFSFGAKPAKPTEDEAPNAQPPQEIAAPQQCKDTMLTPQPLTALYIFYRYYLLQPKYKTIVKVNLDHKGYFKKRDRLLEIISEDQYKNYFVAATLMFLAL